jgi:hypothetical protein
VREPFLAGNTKKIVHLEMVAQENMDSEMRLYKLKAQPDLDQLRASSGLTLR